MTVVTKRLECPLSAANADASKKKDPTMNTLKKITNRGQASSKGVCGKVNGKAGKVAYRSAKRGAKVKALRLAVES